MNKTDDLKNVNFIFNVENVINENVKVNMTIIGDKKGETKFSK
ncbi:hypothetical protein GM3709_251 [Geminocystis sp. NIES-3709]|nr:hypothetical protein GM3709_251 [Geminocystis sp. NIES-3709]